MFEILCAQVALHDEVMPMVPFQFTNDVLSMIGSVWTGHSFLFSFMIDDYGYLDPQYVNVEVGMVTPPVRKTYRQVQHLLEYGPNNSIACLHNQPCQKENNPNMHCQSYAGNGKLNCPFQPTQNGWTRPTKQSRTISVRSRRPKTAVRYHFIQGPTVTAGTGGSQTTSIGDNGCHKPCRSIVLHSS